MKLFKLKVCAHNIDVQHKKYFSQDGTPMIRTECKCGYVDEGHVYVDVNDWKEDVIVIRNGLIV
jgi:hypothetical protein